MKFALILLIIMAAACIVGSVVPQGNVAAWYLDAYPQALAGAVLALKLDDVFHSVWFLVLTVFLCVNLLLCSLTRFPVIVRTMKTDFTLEKRLAESGREAYLETEGDPRAIFEKTGFRSVAETGDTLYAAKNKAGLWGAWLTHLGVLVVIFAFGFGEVMQFESSVYGFAGDALGVPGTDMTVIIDDFNVYLRDDATVEQYVSDLTIKKGGEAAKGQASVNHPFGAFGYKFYQNSTGWGAGVTVTRDGETIQEARLCAGEYVHVEGTGELHLMLRAFYPDYAVGEDGAPSTSSSRLDNPGYLYMLYYGEELLGMNVLTGDDVITVDDITISFHDPESYTLIEIKRDPLEKLAMLGGLTVLLALILAFYVQPAELWAVKNETGGWSVYGRCRRAEDAFRENIQRKAEIK